MSLSFSSTQVQVQLVPSRVHGTGPSAVEIASGVPALAQTTTTPNSGAAKMSRADCMGAWTKLDASKIGSVSQSQAQGVVTDFKAADTNNDGKLSQPEFMAACEKGRVTASTNRQRRPWHIWKRTHFAEEVGPAIAALEAWSDCRTPRPTSPPGTSCRSRRRRRDARLAARAARLSAPCARRRHQAGFVRPRAGLFCA
jgi:hypothetical protein